MPKYVKKPVVIDAVLWEDDEKSYIELLELGAKPYISNVSGDGTLYIVTTEGQMRCPVGNWIIKGVEGEFYSCTPTVFNKTYESVT